MQITKREFLKKLGLVSTAGVASSLFGDEFVATNQTLPPGSIGDPANVWFGQRIFPIPRTFEDGPSSYLKDGKVIMPAREIPIFHETEVVVVGGGPAGFSAAISAARAGAKVALVEKSGSLGGLFTNGMVLIVLATSRLEESGKWTLVTRGVCEEFMERAMTLGARNCTRKPVDGKHHWQPTIDPEGAKYLMDRMIEEAGVEMFFHADGIDVIQDGEKVLGVVFQSKQGPQAILAKQVVDCTGDGDMMFAAGCDYRQITHGIGFVARLGNIDRVTAKAPPKDAEIGYDGLKNPWPIHANEGNKSNFWAGKLGPQGDGLSVKDLTAAEILHRKYWWEHVAKMQETPGWEEVYIINTCSQIGPRATRLMEAEYICTRESIKRGENNQDCIGWFGADSGIHPAMRISKGSIIPTKGENIVAAGRCLGAPDTVDTFRLIAPCFVSGQAAGVLAAVAAKSGKTPRKVGYGELKAALEAENVYI